MNTSMSTRKNAYVTGCNAITNTPGFRRWFGDSKVVDAEGKPLVVYHGTAIPKTAFRREGGASGVGAYFTPHRSVAEDYAENDVMEDGDTPEVMEVYLSIQNPYRMRGMDSYSITPERRDEIEARGHDGVINEDNGEIVAFRPEQIKIVTSNRIKQDRLPALPSDTDESTPGIAPRPEMN